MAQAACAGTRRAPRREPRAHSNGQRSVAACVVSRARTAAYCAAKGVFASAGFAKGEASVGLSLADGRAPAATLGAVVVACLFTLAGPVPSTCRPDPKAPPAGTPLGCWPRIPTPLPRTRCSTAACCTASERDAFVSSGLDSGARFSASHAGWRRGGAHHSRSASPEPFGGVAGGQAAARGPPWRLRRTTRWSEVRRSARFAFAQADARGYAQTNARSFCPTLPARTTPAAGTSTRRCWCVSRRELAPVSSSAEAGLRRRRVAARRGEPSAPHAGRGAGRPGQRAWRSRARRRAGAPFSHRSLPAFAV